MVPVLPGLLVGGGAAGAAPGALQAAGVVALLSVEAEEPPPVAGIRTLHVPARDEPGTDLLSHLDSCAAFLSAARAGGGAALVRCHAGVSRSVAVVTAYLMKTNNLTFEEAYATIKAIKSDAKMNEGFECQLKLYEAMGCKVDVSSAIYKQYRLQKVTEKYPDLYHSLSAELQDLPQEVFAVDPTSICQTLNSEVLYRCRKCRRSLFRSSSILSHAEGSGPAAFAHKRITDPAQLRNDSQVKCTSYFIEPVQWMEPVLLGVMEGQLLCPKCTSKLGSFSWRGEQCSCGRWVTPAFQIHKSRVDEMKALPVCGFQTPKT
ncbi:dual specificity protein phosphatase 12 isoform X1 [Mauremys mutica]|uniref:dual specificity protein phosphatase 12 isoform X1 n=1 Tax=Mauremys mutica TaxID=74926 RepID=UPI001D13A534|nr:dual specificity protein phosphatase 12 isoform X1 [Mauremys mutica]